MERKTFSQVLKDASFDWKKEYSSLYYLFYVEDHQINFTDYCTIREYVSMVFKRIPFRGTCLTLDKFDSTNGYNFGEYIPSSATEDYLISFCEYSYNLVCGARDANDSKVPYRLRERMKEPIDLFVEQIMAVIEKIGYMTIENDGITGFVLKSPAAISVAENLEPNLSNLILRYNLHSLKGNLEEKAIILFRLGKKLEGDRKTLSEFNKGFEDDLFTLLNSIDIRHNNTAESSKNYQEYIADMGKNQLEEWYDITYQLVLNAFLILEYIKRHERIKILRKNLKKN